MPIQTPNQSALMVDNDHSKPDAERHPSRIPPIIVFETTYQELVNALDRVSLPKSEYKLKFVEIGIRVLTQTIDGHQKALEALKAIKPCFSHLLASEKLQKFILNGLPELEIDYLREGLRAAGIPFADVKQMTLQIRNVHRAKYLVYFEPNKVRLDELKATPYIHNVSVSWQKYCGPRSRPTQCNNCQLYEHMANDVQCPQQPMMTASKTNRRNNRRKRAQRSRAGTFPELTQQYEENFPPIEEANSKSSEPAARNYQCDDCAELNVRMFTSNELFAITTELIVALRSCANQQDQFDAIASVAKKFGRTYP